MPNIAAEPTEGSSQVLVSAAGLAVGYQGTRIWGDATFDIREGSFTAVLGPNGAGKSTLLRLILGQLLPASGRLTVFGERPGRGDPRIGFTPQTPAFDPDFSIPGRDFVRLGVDGHLWGLPIVGAAQRRARVESAIAAVGARAYADRPIGRLSGGEQQRLLLAHALVGEPRLLLVDEPLSNLDVGNQAAIVRLIGRLVRDHGLTVLLVAHDINPLLHQVDHVLYVANGRTAMGTPGEVITSATLSEIYGVPVEVLTDRLGRAFVAGLDREASHPHA